MNLTKILKKPEAAAETAKKELGTALSGKEATEVGGGMLEVAAI